MSKVKFQVDNAGDGEDLNYPLTREIVTEICGKMFKGTMYYVDKALHEAKMTIDDIDEVVSLNEYERNNLGLMLEG